ncbi:CotH kinase family protein [candidate division KSB1 bacterium]|nr:CotH kinase family protein [candidate division KSB1 bacterium]
MVKFKHVHFIIILCASAPGFLFSQNILVINEFMARNNSALMDEYGQLDDWIELHNGADEPIDIGGFFITDDATIPDKWRIPDHQPNATTIAPDGYLILWADDSPDQGLLHLNFKLDGDGEQIRLYTPHLALVDSVTFTEQRADTSFGRQLDAQNVWQFFPVPTPGTANIKNTIIAPPLFNFNSGMYSGDITLKLSAPQNTEIYFTLDGAEPTRVPAHLYTRPVQLYETKVVRAKCFLGDKTWSETQTATYFIDEQFSLPVFSLTTEPSNLWGSSGIYDNRFEDWEKPVYIEYFEADGDHGLFMHAGIKIHGAGTLDQQSLRLYARSRYGPDVFAHKFFNEINLNQFKRLVLRNGGNDCTNAGSRQTHLRDAIVHALYRQRNPDYPMSAWKPVHVYLNGDYWGIYNLRERQDRFYIQSHYGHEDIDFLEYAAEEGEENEKRNAIAGDWADFESLIHFAQNNNLSQASHYDYIKSQIDINNLCEYWIFQTAVANYDWPFNNQKFYRAKTPGHKWQWVLWDTEFSLGHIWAQSYTWECLARSLSSDVTEKHLEKYPWFAQHRLVPELFKNAAFRRIFINRYYDCLNTTLSTENMLATIDSLADIIRPDIERQLDRWDGSLSEWNNAVQDIRTFAQKRPEIAEQHLRNYFRLRQAVTLTAQVHPAGAGVLTINTITPKDYPWQGRYSPDMPVTMTAGANPGYRFEAWKELPNENSATIELDVSATSSITARFVAGQTTVKNTAAAKGSSDRLILAQNYPNPFNSHTRIQYTLPKASDVSLVVYSITGQQVAILVQGKQEAGEHHAIWETAGLANGIYIYRLNTGEISLTRQMVVLQ